ncbi:MAG TPA: hypothetical protein VK577_05540, partial [Bradyrhizobium sp.]|nr:hypothetical protein [Bradyrhizobium sp.]
TLATVAGTRQQRKQFCALFVRARFSRSQGHSRQFGAPLASGPPRKAANFRSGWHVSNLHNNVHGPFNDFVGAGETRPGTG